MMGGTYVLVWMESGKTVEDATVYDREVARQVEEVKAQSKIHSVDELLHSGATWEIE